MQFFENFEIIENIGILSVCKRYRPIVGSDLGIHCLPVSLFVDAMLGPEKIMFVSCKASKKDGSDDYFFHYFFYPLFFVRAEVVSHINVIEKGFL